MENRYLSKQIQQDLARKMVFVGGPRQVGKTTLSKNFLIDQKGYLNWDVPEHRELILKKELPTTPLWIFDEIHKYHLWRNYLKGIYDVKSAHQKILITGSARLDVYRRDGDSLMGRYFLFHLHPLSMGEVHLTIANEQGLLPISFSEVTISRRVFRGG